MHEETDKTGTTLPQPRMVYVADLACLLCGSPIGQIESPSPNLARTALFKAPGGETLSQVQDWRRLRCDRCGGAALVEELRTVARYPEPADDSEGAPRRGRPPKWLVEQRRRQVEELASMAANAA